INLGPRRPAGTTDEDLEHMARVLTELGRRVSAEGLKLGVHAHMWSQFENRREIDHIMGHTPAEHVAFVLDTGQITLAGIDPVTLARELGHRIIEFHLKDTKPEHRGGANQAMEGQDEMKNPPSFNRGKGGEDVRGLKATPDGIQRRAGRTVE